MRIGVLVSGRGSNLAAILEAVASGRLTAIEPVIVLSNRAGVPALRIAERHRVPTRVLTRTAFRSGGARDAAIGEALAAAGVTLAVLAGYDRLLEPTYFEAYAGRTINVHPSLLPRHGGPGMLGLAVHAAVLASGDAETGVTIHEVTDELDAGPILRQVRVPVLPGEGVERLASRVLAVEHETLVAALADLAAEATDARASASMTRASVQRKLGGARTR